MPHMRVSSADFLKNYGEMADRALTEAVTITRNGRDRLVLLSAEEYDRLKLRDRRVGTLADLTEADLAAIAASEVPPEFAYLDAELEEPRS